MSRFSKVPGAFVTLLVVLAGYWYFRPSPGVRPGSNAVAKPAERGGQLVATVRSEPRSFNRIAVRSQSAELLSLLTQARLQRVNRATFALEPWLA